MVAEEAEGQGEGALALLNSLEMVFEGVSGLGVLRSCIFHGDVSEIRFR